MQINTIHYKSSTNMADFSENNSKIINKIIKNDENEIILLIISTIKENLKPITLNPKEQQ